LALAFGMTVVGCDSGGEDDVPKNNVPNDDVPGNDVPGQDVPRGYAPPEDRPVKDRWGKWIYDTSTATLDYSVADDGVCTITVGGTAETKWGERWKVNAQYYYTAKAGASYVYKFEAWTESGTRGLTVQYNPDDDEKIYKYELISITSTRKTYTVYGDALSNGVKKQVEFQCADQLGTFYVKVLEIKEIIIINPEPFTSIADFSNWLSSASPNTSATPYIVKLNVSDLGGSSYHSGSVGKALRDNNTKYVSLDLSGSTFTSIPCTNYYFVEIDGTTSPPTPIGAFQGCTNLTGVAIPNSVTSIGESAFAYTSLTSVTIPDSVNSIGDYAFEGTNLTSIIIPRNVTSIGKGAFSSCNAINVDTANTTYCSQDGVLYNKAKTTLVQYPAGKTGNTFTIPNSVTSIGDSAFYYCTNLTSVTIPNSVTSIGNRAFYCAGLTSVTFATGSNITDANFGTWVTTTTTTTTTIDYVTHVLNPNDALKNAYKTGRAGTYTRNEDGSVWTKK